jgi:hypothetical protein
LIEGKAGVLVYASAGPDGSLGQAWRPLEAEELAGIERIRRQAEPAVTSRSVRDETRDLCSASPQSLSLRDVEGKFLELGRELFDLLVQDEVREVYERARSTALERQDTMLFLLKLREGSCLQLVPWEILHDGNRFLAKDPRTAIVRYFERPSPVASLEVEPPLRLLVTLASPSDLSPLALEEEIAALRTAYQEMGRLVVPVVKRKVSLGALESVWRRARNEGKPFHIWHHCGHGGWKADGGEDRYVLCLESEGKSQPVEVDQLREIVGFCPGLRIAIFNICHSGSNAGIVPALASLDVPVVIGFQRAVHDRAAIQFASVLHRSLLHIPVELAVSEARSSISINKISFDWAHSLAFSRRRDRGTLLPKPARAKEDVVKQPAAAELRKSRGSISIELDKLAGTGNQVIGANVLGGNASELPNIQLKAREISGSGQRYVGFQMISGFSDSDIQRRSAQASQLLEELDHLVEKGRSHGD